MSQLSIQDVNSAIMFGSFSHEELESVASAVKFRRTQLAKAVKRSVTKGATVKFYNTRHLREMVGTVQKVAIKYITVAELPPHNRLWRVPASMLTVVE